MLKNMFSFNFLYKNVYWITNNTIVYNQVQYLDKRGDCGFSIKN